MRLVEPARRPQHRRRFRRFLRKLLGSILVLAAVVGLTVMVILVAAVADGESSALGGALLAAAVAVVGAVVGTRLVRGRRRLVLFLRRFGFTAATEALSDAVTRSLGSDWRMVTLDDARVDAMGVARRSRRAIRFGWLALLVPAGLVVWWFKSADNATGWDGVFAIIAVIILAFILVVFLLSAAAFLVVGTIAARRAERMKAVVIQRPADLEPVVHRVRRQARRVFSPRLIVAKVTDDLWHETVQELLDVADVAVIDVSQISPNMLWELEVLAQHRCPWVAVGQADSVRDAPDVHAAVGDRDVLVYQAATLARFGPALRAAFEGAIRSRSAPSS